MGIWSMFDVFVPSYETICHVYKHVKLKATFVALMTCGTLSGAVGHQFTCSCPHT